LFTLSAQLISGQINFQIIDVYDIIFFGVIEYPIRGERGMWNLVVGSQSEGLVVQHTSTILSTVFFRTLIP